MKTNELMNDLDDSDDVELTDVELTDEEYSELVSSAYQLIYDTVGYNHLLYTKPDVHNNVVNIVYETIAVQLSDIKTLLINHEKNNKDNKDNKDDIINIPDHEEEYCSDNEMFDTILHKIIHDGFTLFYLNHAPPRESGDTYTNGNVDIDKMKEKIEYLESVPQPEQRTDEWYHFRHKYLTASSLWKVFSTEGARNNLIYGKCAPLHTAKYKSFSLDSPMHWGNKYEPVSIQWYEHTYNTAVSDFGCIPHQNIEYIAASPDGINTSPASERYGRMLEVKNIVNRVINGIPKTEYWIQMQIQMEVCKLDDCDFLETRFIEYESRDEFYNDGKFTESKDNKQKGIIMHFAGENNVPIYEYPPLFQSETEFELWEINTMEKYKHLTWIQNLYWKLEEVSCVLVLRNTMWFDAVLPELNNFWNIIQKEKTEGYEHRAPKRRQKPKILSQPTSQFKCNIDIAKLLSYEPVNSITSKTSVSNTTVSNATVSKYITINIDTETIANTEFSE